jgi:hypothetical protein
MNQGYTLVFLKLTIEPIIPNMSDVLENVVCHIKLASGEAVDTYKAFVSLVFTIEELSYITIRLTYSELLALSLISRIQEYIRTFPSKCIKIRSKIE